MTWRGFFSLLTALLSAGGLAVACGELNVTAVDVARIQVVPDTASIAVGATRKLTARLLDASGNELPDRAVSWTSSEPGFARADADGTITGIAPGVAMITASSGGAAGEARIDVVPAPALHAQPDRIAFAVEQHSAEAELVAITASGGPVAGLTATIQYAQGHPTGWLDATLQASAPPTQVRLIASPGNITPGTYQATVVVAASAGFSVTVPIELQVTALAPAIALGAPSVTFSAAAGGADPPPQMIPITNGGGGSLTGLGASITYVAGQPSGWLTASLSPSSAPSTLTLAARTGTLPQGDYSATVLIGSPVAGNSPQSISVRFSIGAPPPMIALSETSRSFTATAGGPDPGLHAITVANVGGGTLSDLTVEVSYTAGQPGDWLTALLSTPTAPATLTLQPRVGVLPAGVYTATVRVASPHAANSPQGISVSLQVNAPTMPAAIALSQDTATFLATAGGPSPGSRSVQVTNAGGGTLEGLSATVSYAAGQPTGWLNAILAGSTAPTTLALDPVTASLAAGTYNATVQVASAAASNSPRTIAVTVQVSAAPVSPAIALSPTTVGFSAVTLSGNPAAKTVSVTNAGGGTLNGLSTAIRYGSGQPTGWLTASLGSTTAPSTLTLQPTTGLLLPGTYTATVEVRSQAASNSPQTVAVTFQVTAPIIPPAIELTPSSVTFNATAGGSAPASKDVAVRNSGGGTLDALTATVRYGSGQSGWLTATLTSTTAPATLQLSVAIGSLTTGTYNATVEVASSKASNSPQTVAVTLVLEPAAVPPAIGLSATSASFTATAGGANPPLETIGITNAGGGTLDDLSTSVQYGSGQTTGWLNATLGLTTAPTQLTLNATTGALAAGNYNATVQVQAPGASNSPRGIQVTFQVNPAASVPNTVTDLRARAHGDDEIELEWKDNSNNETHFVVQRSDSGGGGPWSNVATLPPDTRSYRDSGLQEDTRYWYRIHACNAAGCSISSTVSERTDD